MTWARRRWARAAWWLDDVRGRVEQLLAGVGVMQRARGRCLRLLGEAHYGIAPAVDETPRVYRERLASALTNSENHGRYIVSEGKWP